MFNISESQAVLMQTPRNIPVPLRAQKLPSCQETALGESGVNMYCHGHTKPILAQICELDASEQGFFQSHLGVVWTYPQRMLQKC